MIDFYAGWIAIDENETIVIDSAAAWGGVVWRIGSRAYDLWLATGGKLDAHAALAWGVVDSIGSDLPRGRSALARESAAMLIGHRGGDALERAEFARLFATGEPAEGLRAFLEKRRPDFRRA
jgi:enoyl-CoA hydratase/carnithine racemase